MMSNKIDDDAKSFFYQGIVRQDRGDVLGVVDDQNEAIRLTPSADAFNNRDILPNRENDESDVIHSSSQAIDGNSDYVEALISHGYDLYLYGEFDRALEEF